MFKLQENKNLCVLNAAVDKHIYMLECLWSGGSGCLSIVDDGTRIDEGASPLRVVRDYRTLTEIEPARRSGVKPSHISAIETGRPAGTTRTILALAKALGAPLGVLAGE